jgi:hypothetical protein
LKQFKSHYFDEEFSHAAIDSRMFSAFGLFVGTFAMAGILNYDRDVYGRRPGLITRIITGLSDMTSDEYAITAIIAVALAILVFFLLGMRQNGLKIIVGAIFLPDSKILKLRVRSTSGSWYDHSVSFGRLLVLPERLSDRISGEYDCLTFTDEGTVIGHYFKDHEMWDSKVASQFENEIKLNQL